MSAQQVERSARRASSVSVNASPMDVDSSVTGGAVTKRPSSASRPGRLSSTVSSSLNSTASSRQYSSDVLQKKLDAIFSQLTGMQTEHDRAAAARHDNLLHDTVSEDVEIKFTSAKSVVEGRLSSLGPEATAEIVGVMSDAHTKMCHLLAANRAMMRENQQERLEMRSTIDQLEGLLLSLDERHHNQFTLAREMQNRNDFLENLGVWCRVYVQAVMTERLAWQRKYGINPGDYPKEHTGFVRACSLAMSASNDIPQPVTIYPHEEQDLQEVLESTRSRGGNNSHLNGAAAEKLSSSITDAKASTGSFSAVANRFLTRCEARHYNDGVGEARYVEPREELALLGSMLADRKNDVVTLQRELTLLRSEGSKRFDRRAMKHSGYLFNQLKADRQKLKNVVRKTFRDLDQSIVETQRQVQAGPPPAGVTKQQRSELSPVGRRPASPVFQSTSDRHQRRAKQHDEVPNEKPDGGTTAQRDDDKTLLNQDQRNEKKPTPTPPLPDSSVSEGPKKNHEYKNIARRDVDAPASHSQQEKSVATSSASLPDATTSASLPSTSDLPQPSPDGDSAGIPTEPAHEPLVIPHTMNQLNQTVSSVDVTPPDRVTCSSSPTDAQPSGSGGGGSGASAPVEAEPTLTTISSSSSGDERHTLPPPHDEEDRARHHHSVVCPKCHHTFDVSPSFLHNASAMSTFEVTPIAPTTSTSNGTVRDERTSALSLKSGEPITMSAMGQQQQQPEHQPPSSVAPATPLPTTVAPLITPEGQKRPPPVVLHPVPPPLSTPNDGGVADDHDRGGRVDDRRNQERSALKCPNVDAPPSHDRKGGGGGGGGGGAVRHLTEMKKNVFTRVANINRYVSQVQTRLESTGSDHRPQISVAHSSPVTSSVHQPELPSSPEDSTATIDASPSSQPDGKHQTNSDRYVTPTMTNESAVVVGTDSCAVEGQTSAVSTPGAAQGYPPLPKATRVVAQGSPVGVLAEANTAAPLATPLPRVGHDFDDRGAPDHYPAATKTSVAAPKVRRRDNDDPGQVQQQHPQKQQQQNSQPYYPKSWNEVIDVADAATPRDGWAAEDGGTGANETKEGETKRQCRCAARDNAVEDGSDCPHCFVLPYYRQQHNVFPPLPSTCVNSASASAGSTSRDTNVEHGNTERGQVRPATDYFNTAAERQRAGISADGQDARTKAVTSRMPTAYNS